MRKSKSSSARINSPSHQFRRISTPACFGGFAIRRQLPISDLQSASSNGARTKKYQFRRISNPQRNRSNLFCLRISNPQERLRRIEAPACFGGFAIRRQLPISDLQSASSNGARTKKYQFRRISNPQRNRSNLFCLRISNPQERLRRIEAPACFGGFAIRRRTGNYCGFVIR